MPESSTFYMIMQFWVDFSNLPEKLGRKMGKNEVTPKLTPSQLTTKKFQWKS